MTWMWVVGLFLVVFGGLAIWGAVGAQRRVRQMMAADTLSVPELEQLRGISDELGARGGFRKVCEVVGAAAPGPQGLLRAEMTGTECVWHAQRVQRRYKSSERDTDGARRSVVRTETVAQNTSAAPFTLVRDGHTIVVDHDTQHPDGVEQVRDHFEETRERRHGWERVVGVLRNHDGETIGFQYTEWALRPGTSLYVLGEVHDRAGALTIGRPDDRAHHFLMSTKSEEQLTGDHRRTQRRLARLGAVFGAVGLVLLVLAVAL